MRFAFVDVFINWLQNTIQRPALKLPQNFSNAMLRTYFGRSAPSAVAGKDAFLKRNRSAELPGDVRSNQRARILILKPPLHRLRAEPDQVAKLAVGQALAAELSDVANAATGVKGHIVDRPESGFAGSLCESIKRMLRHVH